MSILKMVKNKKVRFVRYSKGNFIYVTECGLEFPVPLEDIGDATLLAQDKAILFMRYINKHIEVWASRGKDIMEEKTM